MTTSLLPTVETEFDRITAELTRRGFLGGTLGTATLLGLTACGSSGQHAGTPSRPPATRQVDSVNGPVSVPRDPKRVVTLDGFSMAAMFDLGLEPVGVYSAGAQYVEPQFLARWQQLAKISDGTVGGAIDVEKVAALRPDLIIGIDAQKPPYAQLKAIAPTVILPFSSAKTPWRDLAKDTATTLGQTGAFQALQQRYTTRAAAIKAAHADVLRRTRWDVLQGGFDDGQFWLYGPGSDIGGILADAGVRFASASAGVTDQQNCSYEQIGTLSDSDAIFYYATNDGKPANLGPRLFAQPLWRTLPAVAVGHVFGSIYFLPSGYSDALGALDSLDAALGKLGGAA